ncbi:hypothetical protein BAE44_0007405 [Dichanthelium oligosanthes]|uniref:Uncharacterized protein n=1 Tax=Dichanthelium oligosanthes TaxID=888268 RepID=A0A1E5W2N5_9POAL|nr:hypothetical protein BAE44_0007405 [Dichanthelium oligosanthes]
MGAHRHHPKGKRKGQEPRLSGGASTPSSRRCSLQLLLFFSFVSLHHCWFSLIDSSQQPALKFYRKCLPNNPHFALTMHSAAKSMGKAMIMKRTRLKPHATDIKRNPQAHELYKLVYRLPENLSWLLEPPEIPKRPDSKKKKQKDEMVTSKFGVILEWEGVVVEDDDPDLEPRVWLAARKESLEEGIKTVGLQGYFDAIVALEDFCLGKPDGEMFEVAAEELGLEPDVCVVFGNSNLTTESAHIAGMRGRESDMAMEIVVEE